MQAVRQREYKPSQSRIRQNAHLLKQNDDVTMWIHFRVTPIVDELQFNVSAYKLSWVLFDCRCHWVRNLEHGSESQLITCLQARLLDYSIKRIPIHSVSRRSPSLPVVNLCKCVSLETVYTLITAWSDSRVLRIDQGIDREDPNVERSGNSNGVRRSFHPLEADSVSTYNTACRRDGDCLEAITIPSFPTRSISSIVPVIFWLLSSSGLVPGISR